MDITMAHGGSVGSEDNSLSIDAGGRITIAADEGYALDGVYLESPSGDPLHTAPITAGTIRIDAAGDIDPVEAAPEPPKPGEEPEEEEEDEDVIIPSFTATDLTLNSTGGDTGTREDPIYVYTDGLSAMGEQVNIINLKDTRLDQVIADGEANITSTGDITAGEPDTPGGNHVIAGDAELIAEEGDVGTKEEPIKVQAGTVAAEGDNVYLTSDGDIIADGIKARDEVHLVTGGSVKDDPDGHGHAISSKDLYIWAGGSIGEEGNPLNVRVTGRIEAYSRLDMIYLFNYRPPIVHLPYLFPDADGNIRPGDPLTRGEAAQAIYILLSLMAAELPEGLLDVALPENPFADLDADSPYYEMILTLYALGAFDGWQLDGVFDADAQITRAELLSLLVWMLRLTGRELPGGGGDGAGGGRHRRAPLGLCGGARRAAPRVDRDGRGRLRASGRGDQPRRGGGRHQPRGRAAAPTPRRSGKCWSWALRRLPGPARGPSVLCRRHGGRRAAHRLGQLQRHGGVGRGGHAGTGRAGGPCGLTRIQATKEPAADAPRLLPLCKISVKSTDLQGCILHLCACMLYCAGGAQQVRPLKEEAS